MKTLLIYAGENGKKILDENLEKIDAKYAQNLKNAQKLAKNDENIAIFCENFEKIALAVNFGKEFGYKIQGEIFASTLNNLPTLDTGFHVLNVYENSKLVKSEKRVLIASSNQGKIAIYAEILTELNIPYCSLRDLSVNISVEETGETELENAMIKAVAYHNETGLPVIANDSGLFIEKFSKEDQPGVFVRRYGKKELSDEEMIKIFSEKLEKVGGSSDSYFNVAMVICDREGKFHSKLVKSYRYMVSKPSPVVVKALPLRSLDYSKKYHKYMSEMTTKEANECEGSAIEEQRLFIKSVLA